MLLQAPFTNKVEDDPLATSNFFKYPFNPTQDGRRYYIHYVIRSDEQSKLEVPLLYYKLVRYNENGRSEEHTSELKSLMRISYAVFCLKKNNIKQLLIPHTQHHNPIQILYSK